MILRGIRVPSAVLSGRLRIAGPGVEEGIRRTGMKKQGGTAQEKDDVRKKIEAEAHAIWLKRRKLGIPGDAVGDWVAAEKSVLGKTGKKK
jgi:hypothetical protein